MKIPGAKLLFGGKSVKGSSVPKCYGLFEPTAIHVPLKQIVKNKYFDICTTEVFAPF